MFSHFTNEEELDLLTLIEPLACVQHAYKRLPETLMVESACILGGGPIGSLHIIEICKRFPGVAIQLVDPSRERQDIARRLFPEIAVAGETPLEKFDLVIVATSEPIANLTAIAATKENGVVIHFSGLNHQEKIEFESVDIERVHRNEEIRVLRNGVRLVGSSGYSRPDIHRAIQSLRENPRTYAKVQTAIVSGIDSNLLLKQDGKIKLYSEPVISTFLKRDSEYLNELKVVFRVRHQDRALQVSPKKISNGYVATVRAQKELPKLAEGFVRLQVLRFSICNTDRRVLDGSKNANISDAFVLGHEGIGRIVDDGSGANKSFRSGDLAMILPHFYEPKDPLLKIGVPYLSLQLKHLGIHIDGCFASFVDLPLQCVFPIASPATQVKGQERVFVA